MFDKRREEVFVLAEDRERRRKVCPDGASAELESETAR